MSQKDITVLFENMGNTFKADIFLRNNHPSQNDPHRDLISLGHNRPKHRKRWL